MLPRGVDDEAGTAGNKAPSSSSSSSCFWDAALPPAPTVTSSTETSFDDEHSSHGNGHPASVSVSSPVEDAAVIAPSAADLVDDDYNTATAKRALTDEELDLLQQQLELEEQILAKAKAELLAHTQAMVQRQKLQRQQQQQQQEEKDKAATVEANQEGEGGEEGTVPVAPGEQPNESPSTPVVAVSQPAAEPRHEMMTMMQSHLTEQEEKKEEVDENINRNSHAEQHHHYHHHMTEQHDISGSSSGYSSGSSTANAQPLVMAAQLKMSTTAPALSRKERALHMAQILLQTAPLVQNASDVGIHTEKKAAPTTTVDKEYAAAAQFAPAIQAAVHAQQQEAHSNKNNGRVSTLVEPEDTKTEATTSLGHFVALEQLYKDTKAEQQAKVMTMSVATPPKILRRPRLFFNNTTDNTTISSGNQHHNHNKLPNHVLSSLTAVAGTTTTTPTTANHEGNTPNNNKGKFVPFGASKAQEDDRAHPPLCPCGRLVLFLQVPGAVHVTELKVELEGDGILYVSRGIVVPGMKGVQKFTRSFPFASNLVDTSKIQATLIPAPYTAEGISVLKMTLPKLPLTWKIPVELAVTNTSAKKVAVQSTPPPKTRKPPLLPSRLSHEVKPWDKPKAKKTHLPAVDNAPDDEFTESCHEDDDMFYGPIDDGKVGTAEEDAPDDEIDLNRTTSTMNSSMDDTEAPEDEIRADTPMKTPKPTSQDEIGVDISAMTPTTIVGDEIQGDTLMETLNSVKEGEVQAVTPMKTLKSTVENDLEIFGSLDLAQLVSSRRNRQEHVIKFKTINVEVPPGMIAQDLTVVYDHKESCILVTGQRRVGVATSLRCHYPVCAQHVEIHKFQGFLDAGEGLLRLKAPLKDDTPRTPRQSPKPRRIPVRLAPEVAQKQNNGSDAGSVVSVFGGDLSIASTLRTISSKKSHSSAVAKQLSHGLKSIAKGVLRMRPRNPRRDPNPSSPQCCSKSI